jgi:hypothetical protein
MSTKKVFATAGAAVPHKKCAGGCREFVLREEVNLFEERIPTEGMSFVLRDCCAYY